jgi:hypothetical protein
MVDTPRAFRFSETFLATFDKMSNLKSDQNSKDIETEQPKLRENSKPAQPKSSQLSVKAKIETPKTTLYDFFSYLEKKYFSEKNIHAWNNRTLVEPLRDSLQMVQVC